MAESIPVARAPRGRDRAAGVQDAGALAPVLGLPETALPDGVLDRLPASIPAPPWRLPARAVVWLSVARAPLPAGSAYRDRALPVTVAALVDYLNSPVGPYREVFAGTLLRALGRPTVHVPFIAVDSVPSLQAGRAHWDLPKTLATFTGALDDRTSVRGDGWSVDVAVRTHGPPLPAVAALLCAQGGRRAAVTVRGTVRPARVTVAATGPTLGGWLGAGRHVGFLAHGHVVVDAARSWPRGYVQPAARIVPPSTRSSTASS